MNYIVSKRQWLGLSEAMNRNQSMSRTKLHVCPFVIMHDKQESICRYCLWLEQSICWRRLLVIKNAVYIYIVLEQTVCWRRLLVAQDYVEILLLMQH